MIYEQVLMPTGAQVGDAWVCPHKSFKRVLSRGGAWENVNLGETHRDEVNHEQEQREPGAEPEQRESDSTEVPGGTGESTSGNGDDGETVSEPSEHAERTGAQVAGVEEEPGIDGNGSPVV